MINPPPPPKPPTPHKEQLGGNFPMSPSQLPGMDSLVPQGTLVVPDPTPVKAISPATASTTSMGCGSKDSESDFHRKLCFSPFNNTSSIRMHQSLSNFYIKDP